MENKTVLDFGCGTGANCSMSRAEHYFGIDLDAKRIQFAKRLFPSHTFKVFDGNQIPLPNQRVDVILIVAVLHHIPNELINKYLGEFQRVLKPGGNLMVLEPYFCLNHKISNWFMNRYDDGNYIRNEDDYLRLFTDQGFDCRVLKKFRKCFLYNEIMFTAKPRNVFRGLP